MWNNFGDITKRLAEKAAAAAENIEGQLNESVGASTDVLSELSKKKAISNNSGHGSGIVIGSGGALDAIADVTAEDEDDPFGDDDGFYDDDDSFDVDMHDDGNNGDGDSDDDGDKGGMESEPEHLVVAEEITIDKLDSPEERMNAEAEAEAEDVAVGVVVEEEQELAQQCLAPVEELGALEKISIPEPESEPEPASLHLYMEEPVIEQQINEIQDEGLYDDNADDEEIDFDDFGDISSPHQIPQPEVEAEEVMESKVEAEAPVEITSGDATEEEPQTQNAYAQCQAVQHVNENEFYCNDTSTNMQESSETMVQTAPPMQKKNLDPTIAAPESECLPEDTEMITETEYNADADSDTDTDNGKFPSEFPTSTGSEESFDMEEIVEVMETIVEGETLECSEQINQYDEDISLRPLVQPTTPVMGNTTVDNNNDGNDDDVDDGNESDDESVFVSKEEALLENGNSFEMGTLKSQILQLEIQLSQRESQLESKSDQITTMLEMHEKEKRAIEVKVKETKEEAKKRITKAKEKVDELKIKIAEANARANSAGSASQDQGEIIAALREEGEKLARKQSTMEHSVREARLDMRDLKSDLELEKTAKEIAEAKIVDLERDLKQTRQDLSAAKQKGGLADKLDSDLLAAREEREKNASIILGLEAKVKESKAKNSELQKDMEEAFKDKVAQLESDSTSIRNEKDAILHDLESKLRTSEREANLREDQLRHEVNELRKRWQDAVRRCDALSIDLQQSSAPLMRQLESTERQNRARSAAWAELESKLRSDLEENIIENETLCKEKNEIDIELKRSNRSLQGIQADLIDSKKRVEELTEQLSELTSKHGSTVTEFNSMKTDFADVEQMLKESESNHNRALMNAVQETEDRCSDHIESLQVELRQERDKKTSLEEKVQAMMENSTSNNMTGAYDNSNGVIRPNGIKMLSRNLSNKTNQADILQDTLFGLGDNEDEGGDNETASTEQISSSSESFAFIEQLSQALKAAKSERDTLRKQLLQSEERRNILENDTVSNAEAVKSLPMLEAKLKKLTREAAMKDMEIQALQEDINEVRDMYRSQLSALLGGDDGSTAGAAPPGAGQTPEQAPSNNAPAVPVPVVPSSAFGGMRTF